MARRVYSYKSCKAPQTVVDVFTRECLAIEVGHRLSGTDVVTVLNRIKQSGRVPGTLFCDNGSEFTSHILDL